MRLDAATSVIGSFDPRKTPTASPFHDASPKPSPTTKTGLEAGVDRLDAMDSLRTTLQPLLQPITHNLPTPIRDLGVSLLGDQCYSSLVLDIDVTDADCLKLAVSKALGIGIVAASSIVKVPQIINLVRSRSASGVSFLSYLLETTSYLISLAYNVRNAFPFSTYGETALILGQNVVITVLVLNYSGRASVAALFVAVLAAVTATLFSEAVVDMGMLGYLQAGAGTLGVASKLPQILAIWQEGSTGQLSAFTVSLPCSISYPRADLCCLLGGAPTPGVPHITCLPSQWACTFCTCHLPDASGSFIPGLDVPAKQ